MPDRRLKQEEMQKFLQEKKTGKLQIIALEVLSKESTEPTLHDLCLHELHGIAEALKVVVIKQGRAISELKERIKDLEEKKETKP